MKPPNVMNAATMENIVGTPFPNHPICAKMELGQVEVFSPFSVRELEQAARTLRNKKAPGPDGIPSEVLKHVIQHRPSLLLNAYNSCLTAGVFPSRWKTARLVLLSKGKGYSGLPSSFRPLCMLDTAGKLLEKLIKARLLSAIEAAGDLSPRKYGFRAGRSTIDAIRKISEAVERAENHNQHSRRVVLLVTLDVKNAFNSARWRNMTQALEHTFKVPRYLLRMTDDYLRNRTLRNESTEGRKEKTITAGATQGSVLGPDLWNVAYNDLLRAEMLEGTLLVGYADDVAVLIAARDVEMVHLKLNQVMRKVNG